MLMVLVIFWQASPFSAFGTENKSNELVKLRLLETTDLHAALVNYNYYQGKKDERIGLIKTSSLIRQARAEAENSLLFDVGDHLQGNPLGGYMAWVRGLTREEIHPVYRAFNRLGYDAITIGNHEFNYGLEFLNKSLTGAKMPVVNANVFYANENKPYFRPFTILKKTVVDESGQKHKLHIGVIGVLPSQIMNWDKEKLEGQLRVIPMIDAVKMYIPEMKKHGSDIIILLAHTGISSTPYDPNTENAAYYLAAIPEIDAVLTGHSHAVFPGPVFQKMPNTSLENGTIYGKPVVMAGSKGSRLGIIDLNLQKVDGKWKITSSNSTTRPIADENGVSLVKTDQSLFKIIKDEHLETIDYMKKLGL
jgi:2',3'-cyclic-nucleotide 2'-phosphodiesterase/3'-nucleotidase